jgi:flagellar biogenesis protein FliO
MKSAEKGCEMKHLSEQEKAGSRAAVGGLAGWMLKRFRARRHAEPRLAVLERIALAPRQTLALVEADGRRFLVATSPEGTPSFHALDGPGPRKARRISGTKTPDREARISW